MFVACVVGLGTGLLFKPLSLIPILAVYCLASIAVPLLFDGLPSRPLGHLALDVVLVNVGYLAGAAISRLLFRG